VAAAAAVGRAAAAAGATAPAPRATNTAAPSVVVELDGVTFYAALRDEARDLFVAFYRGADGRAAAEPPLNEAGRRIADADAGDAVRLALYDVGAWGVPAGMHLASTPHCILFPAGGRDPVMYDWRDDARWGEPALASDDKAAGDATAAAAGGDGTHTHADGSTCSGHHHAHDGDDHDHDHHHHHHDAPPLRMTAAGVLAFLRTGATYGREVPAPTLADRWRGKDLFGALADGLAAVRAQAVERDAEVASLRAEVASLRAKLAAANAKCSPPV